MRQFEINKTPSLVNPNNFFPKFFPCSVCGLRPPPQKKKNTPKHTPAEAKNEALRGYAQSPHRVNRLSVMRLEGHRAVRLGALRSVCRGSVVAQSRSVALRSVCGDTCPHRVNLWRYRAFQGRSVALSAHRVQRSVKHRVMPSNRLAPSPSQRISLSRTPKTATPRPYRDTLLLHFVLDLHESQHTPSLTAEVAQGSVLGVFDTGRIWLHRTPHWTR